MIKYAWATDIHLDFMSNQGVIDFAESLVSQNPDGIFLTGDISIAPSLTYHLSALEKVIQRPIYFVLGNHDYYKGRIDEVRKQMHELSNMSQYLRYMPTTPYVVLSPTTAVVGHDGWYDARFGAGAQSQFRMVDWHAIYDFWTLNKSHAHASVSGNYDMSAIITLAQKLAHDAVVSVANGIKAAVRYHKNVIVLTHFPPFAESHIHNGKVGDDHAMPWFTSKIMGDMLLQAAQTHSNVNFTILAGHTHGAYNNRLAKNLHVLVGGAEYGQPRLQQMIDIAG